MFYYNFFILILVTSKIKIEIKIFIRQCLIIINSGRMSVESLPQYPNLFTLSNDELKEIETDCIKNGHLDPKISLLDQISQDAQILLANKISKEDIYINHRNMNLKFNNLDKFDAYTTTDHGEHHKDLLRGLPVNFGKNWCNRNTVTNEIELNGQKLRITRCVWGGAEECSIEKHFSKKYNGYDRGDRDWFVTNLTTNEQIWIPDLLPAQVGMFGFFQSPCSPYRIDPIKYINVMGINGPITPLPIIKTIVWSFPSGPMKKESWLSGATIIKEEKNDLYDATLVQKNDKIRMVINFVEHQIKSLIPTTNHIEIFGKPIQLKNIFNYNDYLCYDEYENIKLVEGDDTAKMESKMKPECIIC
mgnify:CR=1 FL=1